MGWRISPKVLLLIVCVYDAWVFSEDLRQCPKGELFCDVVKSCSTKEKCDAACPKDQLFCPVIKSCTTSVKCDAAREERKQLEAGCIKEKKIYCPMTRACSTPEECRGEITDEREPPTCSKGEMFCKVIYNCTTQEKCDAALAKREQLKKDCVAKDLIYCPMTRACSTYEECRGEITDEREPPTCSEGEMFCKVIHNCTTQEKCVAALAKWEQLEKDCGAKDLIYCPMTRACSTYDECRGETTDEREPPTCSEGEMFCKVIHNCTTQEKCVAALAKREQLENDCGAKDLIYCPMTRACSTYDECRGETTDEREPPTCSEGEMFCKVIHNCTTQEKCDAALAKREQLKKDCVAKDLIYCPMTRACSTYEECRGETTDEREPPTCSEGEMFCKVIHNCTTQEKCVAALAKREQRKKDCVAKDLIYCPSIDDCSSKKECFEPFVGKHSNFTTCGDDEKHCRTADGVECIGASEDCPCLKKGMKYCDSIEHCIPVDQLKDGNCPPECAEDEMYCPKLAECLNEDEFEADCDRDPLGDKHFNFTRCGEDEKHCRTADGVECIRASEDCPCLKKGMKYCDSIEHCIPVDQLKDGNCPPECAEDEMYCPKLAKCLNEDEFEADCDRDLFGDKHFNFTRCGEDEKHCRTADGVECIGASEDCPCLKKGMKYCDSIERCIPVDQLKDGNCPPECEEDEMYCPKLAECLNEDEFEAECDRDPLGEKHFNFTRCGEDEKHCRTADGVECIGASEDCPCLKKGMKYCDSIEHCIPVDQLKDGNCPPECAEDEMYCPKLAECLNEDEFEADCDRDPFGDKHFNFTRCGEDEKHCRTADGVECIGASEDCPCLKKGMKYCDSVERCIPLDQLKDGTCPPECEEDEIYCLMTKACSTPTECREDTTDEKGLPTRKPPTRKSPTKKPPKKKPPTKKPPTKKPPTKKPPTKKPPTRKPLTRKPPTCSNGEKHCRTADGVECIGASEDCPCLKKGMKYCDSIEHCIPVDQLKDGNCPPECEEDEMYCPKLETCLSEDEFKAECRMIEEESCPEGEVFCRTSSSCVKEDKVKELCSREEPLLPEPCKKGEKQCVTTAGFKCISEAEQCPCTKGTKYCDSVQACLPVKLLEDGNCPPGCDKPKILCRTSGKCLNADEECPVPGGSPRPCPTGDPTCTVHTRPIPEVSTMPPKNKDDYFFLGTISANLEKHLNRGGPVGETLKGIRFKEARVEGMLENVGGTWQVLRSTVGSKVRSEWTDLRKEIVISPKDSIRFLPANASVHGFEGIELKIGKVSKYIGIIVYPCVVPRLVIKKELSGEEEKPLKFNVDDVFEVTRSRPKQMESNLYDEYNEFVPAKVLSRYKEMLSGSVGGENLGVAVKSTGGHKLVKEGAEKIEEESDDKRIKLTLPVRPKIFAVGSKLAFIPAKDVFGVIKILVFPVDLPPDTKDITSRPCAVGEGMELIINIANVNDKPSPRPDPRNPAEPKLVVSPPSLPYKLRNHAANEGFTVKTFAKFAGRDVDGDILGIAVVKAERSPLGIWQYLDGEVWQNIEMAGLIQDQDADLLFLPPAQKIRFKPAELAKVWRKNEALELTMFRFLLWDQSNNLGLGRRNVSLKGNNALSIKVLSSFMERLGCDDRPSSGRVLNECGECGKKSCKKCDGSTDSTAIINECKICVLGSTGLTMDEGKDCRKICGGPNIRNKKCDKCVNPQGKKVTDCSGACLGTKRINRCDVCSDDKNAGADSCGVCGGDNSTCIGCDGIIRSTKKVDRCGKCLDPKSPKFDKSCINLAAISPKLHKIGQKMTYKLDASGFPESGASCELRRADVVVALEVLSGPHLVVEGIDTPGIYNLVCTISGEEYTLDEAVTVFNKKIIVEGVEPSEVNVGDNMTHVLVTGKGFLESKELSCIYQLPPKIMGRPSRSRRSVVPSFTKRIPAEFVSSTKCKCKINTRESAIVKIAVTLDKMERDPQSYVSVEVLGEALGIKKHKFNNKIKTITVTFTSAVKKIGKCDIFTDATVAKLRELVSGERKFSCHSSKAEELKIRIPGAVIEEDLQLDFKLDAVKPSKGLSRAKQLSITVKAPAITILPIAVITAPKQVGSCDKIKISARNSKSNGKFQSRWSVGIKGVTDEGTLESKVVSDLAALRNILNANRGFYVIPNTNVLKGLKYVFKLVVSNREGSSLEVRHFLERSAKDIPSVRFITKAKVFDLRKKMFVLKVKAKRPECVDDSKLIFSWSCISHPQLELVKTDGPSLVLRREKLECDEQYQFSLTAYLNSNPDLRTYLTYNFTTKAAPLKFGISGGDQVVPSNGVIRLKARATSKVTCGGELKYIFSCSDEDDYPCLVKNKDGESKELADIEKPLLRLHANRFVANKTYIFKLGVFKGTQNVERSVKVTVAPGTPPTVAIRKPKDGPNPVISVIIKSSRKNSTSFKCEGVEEAGFGYLDLEDKRKVTGEVTGKRMTFNQRRLKFTLKGLEAGVEYKVRCFAYKDDTPDEIGESTTTFKIESPPEGGALSVEPVEGISSETVFNIVASEFTSNSNSTITYTFYTEMLGGKRRLLASKRTEQSIDVQLPSGEGEDHVITVVVFAENEFGVSVVKMRVKCSPKTFVVDDFDDIEDKINGLESEGASLEGLLFAGSVISSAEKQEGVKAQVNELQESIAKMATRVLAEKRKDGSGNTKEILALLTNIQPQTDESKEELGKEVSGAVEETVPESVKRRDDVRESGGQQRGSRRRRAIEGNEESDDDDDETGMSIDQVEDALATFENLIDTTVINNSTENFLKTIDSLLINMCMGLPLGETSIALSNLGILKTDMNYLDNVDTTFINMSCTNCSMLNHSALVKFGSELKQLYNEWNCSGDDELCNGLCAAMVQFPHDYITAVTSPVRLSDVIYVELKNPENQNYVPVSSLTQPALFHIPLHAGHSQTGGHKCMIWSESEEQWSSSGCQKTQALTRNGAVFVECSCTQLGYITVHEDDDVTFSTQAPSGTQSPGGQGLSSSSSDSGVKISTEKATQNHVADLKFSFDVDYNTVVRDVETRQQMMKVVEDEIASTMHVDKSMILNVTISPGSIVVRFVLLAPDQNPAPSMNYSITQLMMAVNEGRFVITFNGVQLTADNGTMTYEYKVMTGVSPDETTVKKIEDDSESKLPIILGSIFGFLLIAVIVGAILFRRHLSKQAKVSDHSIRRSQPINNNCAQNTGYQGSTGDNLGRPGTPGNAAPLEHQHSSGGSRAGSPRQTAELPNIN